MKTRMLWGFVGIFLLGGLTGCIANSKMVVAIKGIQDKVDYSVELEIVQ